MADVRVVMAIYVMRDAALRVYLPGGRLPEAPYDEGAPLSASVLTAISEIFGEPGVAEVAVALDIGSLRPAYAELLPPLEGAGDGIVIPTLVLLPRLRAPVLMRDGRRHRRGDCSGEALASRHADSLFDPAMATGRDAAVAAATGTRLIELMRHTRAAMVIAGPWFTMRQLRQVYEAAWGAALDPSNFQKRMLTGGLVERIPPDLSDPPSELDIPPVTISDEPPSVGALQYTYGPDELPVQMTLTIWRDGVGRPAGLFVRGPNPDIDPPFPRPGAGIEPQL